MELNDSPKVIWQNCFHQGTAVKVGSQRRVVLVCHLDQCPAAKGILRVILWGYNTC